MLNYHCIADDVRLGKNVYLSKFINLYGCNIGDNTKIGAFVEIQKDVTIGNHCKISSHSFICSGVVISDGCFIGHGVMFINDNHPKAVAPNGALEVDEDWKDRFVPTYIGRQAVIGSGAIILGGITIGDGAMIGAGSVVTRNVPAHETWYGNPARRHEAVAK
jgi:acetyltransferase-like isoleucine patch superfamily enzyme